MTFYPVDNKRGLEEQKKLLPIIKEFFKTDIIEIDDKHSVFDYKCSNCYYELKTRTNALDKYPTTLIGRNKTISDKDIYLLFKFTDCLTYIKYNKELFDTFEIKKFDRNVKESNKKDYIYIPIKHLIKI